MSDDREEARVHDGPEPAPVHVGQIASGEGHEVDPHGVDFADQLVTTILSGLGLTDKY